MTLTGPAFVQTPTRLWGILKTLIQEPLSA